jgi:uncharacterized protein YecT (DUF1311 family)
MPTESSGEPLQDASHRGLTPPIDAPRGERRWLSPASRLGLVIGAGAAVALGLVLGVLARPDLGGKGGSEAAAHPMAAVPVEVNAPAPPPPVPASNGKLEVLSPDQAARAAASAASPTPMLPILQAPPPLPPQTVASLGTPAPAAAPPRQAQAGGRASVDCAGARSEAEQMVCGDPDLAAADREMSRAYRRALQSGAAPADLRAEQRDWLAIREDAARHSRRALADVYEQRIDELNAAADAAADGPGT